MDQLSPGIFRWTAPHPEWRTRIAWGHEVASYALITGDVLSLVDPQLPAPDSPAMHQVLADLDRLAAEATTVEILITIPYHVRSSEALVARYQDHGEVRVWGHRAAAKRFRAGTRLQVAKAGHAAGQAAIACGIGNPRRYEMPFYFAHHRALAFGDAVVGVEGRLRVWQPSPFSQEWYRERFLPSLHPLLDLDVERVLVTHGPAVLADGRRALAAALAERPWQVG